MTVVEQQLLHVIGRLSDQLGVNPDAELTVSDLAKIRGVDESTIRQRMKVNPVWERAFFPVRGEKVVTTMRRVWRAEDELSDNKKGR